MVLVFEFCNNNIGPVLRKSRKLIIRSVAVFAPYDLHMLWLQTSTMAYTVLRYRNESSPT